MSKILQAYRDGKITRDGILPLLENVIALGVFFDELLPDPCTDNEMDKTVRESKNGLKKVKLYKNENRTKVMMGLAMGKLRGRIPGDVVLNYIYNKENSLTNNAEKENA